MSAPDQPDLDVVLGPRELRRWRLGLLALVGAVMALVAALAVTLPRSAAYGVLVEENLALKARLGDIDRQVSEVDRILLRLRLYGAQLESLSTTRGAHGPLPDDVAAATPLGEGWSTRPPSDELAATWSGVGEARPAEAWAASVQARSESFLARFEKIEPDINEVMAELEDLRALSLALPTTWPTQGELNSGFGWRRSPVSSRWSFHSGIDIGNRRGTPIHAPAAGRVIMARSNEGYGRMVEVDHGFGITTTYAHCNRLFVREGQLVERGHHIADVGSTGRSTGPHLHFEVRIDGHAVDPLDYLPR